MRRYLTILSFTLLFFTGVSAQEDPGLASQIVIWTEKARSELKSQETAMTLETAGQVWMEEEWSETAKIQRLYNDYLESFRDIIVYAAQLYGFYVEIDRMTTNLDALGKVIDQHPSGVFAGALSSRRNQIYRDLLMNALDIVNDIRIACMSEVRMTERQRVDLVFAIRPKLLNLNNQLVRLIRVVKYSTFTDILVEIELIQRKPADRSAITKACLSRWRNRAGMK